MVREIRIYVEGGGNTRFTWQRIRAGFGEFFADLRDLASARGIGLKVVPCGSRTDTFRDFKISLRSHPDAFNVLLVDSETQVVLPRRQHLQQQDGWDLSSLTEDQCHFMAQTVEAWLVADPEALADYYGQGFRRNALPRRKDVEAIPKDDLLQSLNRATADTKKGRYAKIHHCADLLSRLNQGRVRQRARHCELLFSTLESLIEQP